MKLAIAFALGILVAEARWRIKRALAADDARLASLPIETDDGLPPADPYLDWLCIRRDDDPGTRTSGSVTVDARDGWPPDQRWTS